MLVIHSYMAVHHQNTPSLSRLLQLSEADNDLAAWNHLSLIRDRNQMLPAEVVSHQDFPNFQ